MQKNQVFNKKIAYIYLNYGSKGLKVAIRNKIKGQKALYGLESENFTVPKQMPSLNNDNDRITCFCAPKRKLTDLNELRKIINNPEIKVVSFDIFDTLLLRPTIYPKDIFYLIANKVNKLYNIDFISLRYNAEEEMRQPNCSIEDIYRYVAKKGQLSWEVAQSLMEEEIALEKQLLFIREEIYDIYQHAVSMKKHIIVISDMYLPKKVLGDILYSKGYTEIKQIYVSNEFGKRKDTGELFDEVLKIEKCNPWEMVHVGDNYTSDYQNPFKKGILSFYYPSIHDSVLAKDTIYNYSYTLNEIEDPISRVILGFTLNYYAKSIYQNQSASMFSDIYQLGCLGVGPVILAAMLQVLNGSIASKYKKVYFASRDGYIPHIIYNKLIKALGSENNGNYFYAGRVFYYSSTNDTFEKFITPDLHEQNLTLKQFVNAYITQSKYKERIFSKLTSVELNISTLNSDEWLMTLKKIKELIEEYISENNSKLSSYYTKVFEQEKECLVFDCGYSGSISTVLNKIMPNTRFDKLYLWETDKNKELDEKNGTKTYTFFGKLQNNPLNLVFEELMSPLSERPLYIDDVGNIKYSEEENESLEMKEDLNACHRGILDYCDNFIKTFGKFLANVAPENITPLLNLLETGLLRSPYCEELLLRNIVFPDTAIGLDENLARKVQNQKNYSCPIFGTGLTNPANYLINNEVYPLEQKNPLNQKIGIHLHLYDPSLAWEFMEYMKKLPKSIDLYITTSSVYSIKILEKVFGSNEHFLRKPKIILVENRGRDVAPWLITMKDIQTEYDYFCHIHGKQSKQNGENGTLWRKYLLENLLSEKAFSEIMSIFAKYPTVGSVFPGPYKYIYNVWKNTTIEVIGQNEEKFTELVSKILGKKYQFLKADLFFSVGTMLWYRPKALKKLFDTDLKWSDFPSEPIGEDGTYAHAVERIIQLTCQAEGYSAKAWTSTLKNENGFNSSLEP